MSSPLLQPPLPELVYGDGVERLNCAQSIEINRHVLLFHLPCDYWNRPTVSHYSTPTARISARLPIRRAAAAVATPPCDEKEHNPGD